MATHETDLDIEVVYATPVAQRLYAVRVSPGTTAREAVLQSGILVDHPDLDIARCALGIFGERVQPDTVVGAGDRVEIYRPLIADPKESRRRRAVKRAAR